MRVPRVHDPGKTLRHARYGVLVAFTTLPQTSGITMYRTYREVDGVDPVQPYEPARNPLHSNDETLSYHILGPPPFQSVLWQQA